MPRRPSHSSAHAPNSPPPPSPPSGHHGPRSYLRIGCDCGWWYISSTAIVSKKISVINIISCLCHGELCIRFSMLKLSFVWHCVCMNVCHCVGGGGGYVILSSHQMIAVQLRRVTTKHLTKYRKDHKQMTSFPLLIVWITNKTSNL